MFDSKANFSDALRLHRNEIIKRNLDPADGAKFYDKSMTWLWKALASVIQNTMHGTVWRELTGYKLLLRAMENYGRVRAIGHRYFVAGSLDDDGLRNFQRFSAIAKDNIKNGMYYSKTIGLRMVDYVATDANANLTYYYIGMVSSVPVYRNASSEAGRRWQTMLDENDEFLESVRLKLLRDIYQELETDTSSANSKLDFFFDCLFVCFFVFRPLADISVFALESVPPPFPRQRSF